MCQNASWRCPVLKLIRADFILKSLEFHPPPIKVNKEPKSANS